MLSMSGSKVSLVSCQIFGSLQLLDLAYGHEQTCLFVALLPEEVPSIGTLVPRCKYGSGCICSLV